ncbi:hypothetical protein GCM10025331_87010 [Actinoplanes utahensis]
MLKNFFAPPGTSSSSRWCRAADGFGAGPAEQFPPVDEQPQRHGGVVEVDLPQVVGAQRGDGDAVGVDRVGLAALAGSEHAGAGGQLRRHVEDGLAVGDQALGDVPADAAAAFNRPDAVGVFAAGGEHRLVAVAVGAEPALADRLLTLVHALDGRGAFVRVHADDDSGHVVSFPVPTDNVGGRATLLRAGQSPLEPLRAAVTDGPHAKRESHQTTVDSRRQSVPPVTSTKPGRAAVVRPVNK